MSLYGWMLGATALVFLLELVAGRHHGLYRRGDLLTIGLCAILNPAVSRPLAGMLMAAVFVALVPVGKGALADIPLLPAYLGLFLIVEFAFYWVHRWSHQGQRIRALGWLWKIHRTHHAGKYMNVLVTLRINLFWAFVVPTAWLTGLAIYLGQGKAAALVIISIYGWNLITHSHFLWDVKLRRHRLFGPAFRALEHVLISPGVHHVHHGYGRDGASYRNYAVTFAFLDWMFGTLYIPADRPAHYGLPGPQPYWAEEIFYPLVRMKQNRRVRIG